MKRAVERSRAAGHVALDRATIRRYERRYDALLSAGEARQAPPRPRVDGTGRPRRTPAANMLLRLREYRGAVLRFLNDFAVPVGCRGSVGCSVRRHSAASLAGSSASYGSVQVDGPGAFGPRAGERVAVIADGLQVGWATCDSSRQLVLEEGADCVLRHGGISRV